jgi:hypothetical protein
MSEPAVALPPAPPVQFEVEDCELFERYAAKVTWPSGVAADDRERFNAVRTSLNDLAAWLVSSYGGNSAKGIRVDGGALTNCPREETSCGSCAWRRGVIRG